MGWLFGSKDWNVVGLMFERPDLYRVNGNRVKGGQAVTVRDNVKSHARTLYFAVFDQSGKMLESGPGAGAAAIPSKVLAQLGREILTNASVREILAQLEKAVTDKSSKGLEWKGYPPKETPRDS